MASMASSLVGSNPHILEVLDRSNYKHWRSRLKTYLLVEDLWEAVEAIVEPPKLDDDQTDYKAWTKKNVRALYAIQNSCGRELFSFISELETAKSAWEALEEECRVVQGYDENNYNHRNSYFSFRESVRGGDWDKAKKCLGELDVRSVARVANSDGETALHAAAEEGHAHVVKELAHLMTPEDFKTKTSNGHTALHLAVKMGHVHVVKELPVPLMGEVKDDDGNTALHRAIQKGKVDIVKELVVRMTQEDLKIKNDDGYTALHLAVNRGNMDMVIEFVTKEKGDENKTGISDFERLKRYAYSVMRSGDCDNAIDRLRKLDDPCNPAVAYAVIQVAIYIENVDINLIKELVLLLKRRQEDQLKLKTSQEFIAFGCGLDLSFSEEVVMERARYMVEQYEKTIGSILEISEFNRVTVLHLAAWKGYVDIVKELAPLMRQEGLELLTEEGSNALHLAVLWGHMNIARELMPLMRKEALGNKNGKGYTALGCAFIVGKDEDVMEIAKYMAENNKKVLGIPMASNNEIPVVRAIRLSRWELARYLYSVTPLEVLNGPHGSSFICYCLNISKTIDLAWDLLHRFPNLAFTVTALAKGTPIMKLAGAHFAFLSGTRLTCWQRWLYHCIYLREIDHVILHDINIDVDEPEDNDTPKTRFGEPQVDRFNTDDTSATSGELIYYHSSKRNFISSSVTNVYRELSKSLCVFSGIQRIYEMKSTHRRIFKILHCIGEEIRNDNLETDELDTVQKSILKAIEQGHFEFVTQLCKINPDLLLDNFDEKRRSIFHFAIENRQKEVYSLIYGLNEEKRNRIGIRVVNHGNTMLHSAANLSSLPQFNHIQDASLQMQRELQWFKEVESVVPPEMHERRNTLQGLTARELFTKTHKKLLDDAENSTKGTATSCTVVGALTVTMMFAAAFTVPGGNDGNTGLPLLQENRWFKVFIVSDTISLVSSTTSVITFLGILTSRFAEDDFLTSLPTKMMIGLFTLFLSIATMMIAFSCALAIMLDGEAWIVIPSILLATVPALSFVWLLLPLLGKMFMSTYRTAQFVKIKQLTVI